MQNFKMTFDHGVTLTLTNDGPDDIGINVMVAELELHNEPVHPDVLAPALPPLTTSMREVLRNLADGEADMVGCYYCISNEEIATLISMLAGMKPGAHIG